MKRYKEAIFSFLVLGSCLFVATPVFADSPIFDTFDSFNSKGWQAWGGSAVDFHAETSDCVAGQCIKGFDGYSSGIPRAILTGEPVSEGSLSVWARSTQGWYYGAAYVSLCDSSISCADGNRIDLDLLYGNTPWYQFFIAWRKGSNFLEYCKLVGNLVESLCSWQTSNLASTSIMDTVAVWRSNGGRGDLGDNTYFDELGPPALPLAITASTTLPVGVYTVTGMVTIDPGVVLTLTPGTRLKFNTATTSGLLVDGTLDIPYEDGSFTFLTSLKDDLIGGDTNGDATSTSPAIDDWAGIQINPGGVVTMSNTVVRYGGSVGGSGAMLNNNGGLLSVASSTVVYGSGYGIKNSSGTTTITTTDLAFNDYGLYVSGGNASITASSTIHDNTTYGIYNSTGVSVNAEDNWWATSTGPYHSSANPSGGGDAVSDDVDFSPYRSSIHYFLGDGLVPSVSGCLLRYNASTTAYSSQLSDAVDVWNGLGRIDITPATSTIDLNIFDVDRSDVVWKGRWNYISIPDEIELNSYYLSSNSYSQVQHTITHELGHSLGLGHSYTGNTMFLAQSSQTSLGTQDVQDYESLWQNCI